MELSIIVPVYNMASDDKLVFCLDSLLNQTISDYEVIAVDDASPDDSADILREYEKKFPEKLKVIYLGENLRQGGAKNRALEICRGDYIGFVDSDDWVASDMYEKLLREAHENRAEIVHCDHVVTDEHSMRKKKILREWSPGLQGDMTDETFRKLINCPGHMVTKIFARKLFFEPELRFPEHMFYEDNAVALELLHRADRIACVCEPMYYYYQHAGSTVHLVSEERCENRMEAMRMMLKYAREGEYLEKFYPEIEFRFTNLFYQNTLFSYMQGKQHKRLRFIRELGKEMKDSFPEFEKNRLYLEKVNLEERRLIGLQQRSSLMFLCIYKALWFYRSVRYGRKEGVPKS